MFKHILIPTDGSAVAAKAVKAGIALAKEHGARVTGFHAAEPVPQRLYGEGYVVDKEMAKEFERRQLDSQIKIGGQTWDVRTGLEYWYKSMVAMRSGADGKTLAFGAGLRYKQIGVDYAAQLHRFFAVDAEDFPDDTNLDTTHLVSASFSW